MFKEDKDTNVNTMLDGYKLNSPVLNPIHSHDRLSSQSVGLFHQMTSNFFNEMTDDQAMSGEACARIEHWLSQHSVEELEELNQIAKQHFYMKVLRLLYMVNLRALSAPFLMI